ncbi:serine hydrolase [Streptomyces sp. NPDC059578]|uniref:serine hydrolase n=1 Tax=Streptomyces sp. NPDC059578 TaxID=3346874 RepID=UPI0036BA76D1
MGVRGVRGFVAGTVVAAVVAGAGVVGTGTAVAAAPAVTCTSAKAGLAAKLKKDITAALKNRSGTVAVGLYDRKTKTKCELRGGTSYDSASIVKVTVLAALLWDYKKTNRLLTTREASLAKAMITKSDNAATSTFWRQLGTTKIKKFLKAAGMKKTVPGADGYWGLTRVNIKDEQRLLSLITTKNSVLSDGSRAYLMKLMNQVISSQRWGTPAGAPSSTKKYVKNGWLPRAQYGWRVHSIGAFQGGGRDYYMTVLTHGNRNMNYGVATIQAVAKAIHKDLAPGTAAAQRYVPTATPRGAIPAVPEAPGVADVAGGAGVPVG